MKVKTLVLGLIFLVLVACEKDIKSPYSPELPEPNPGPTTDYYCVFEASLSMNTAANGCVQIFIDDVWCGSFNEIDFSPLSDNPEISEGAISFWEKISLGTHILKFVFECDTFTLVLGYPAPSLWTIRMNVSSGNSSDNIAVTDGIQEVSFAEWDMNVDDFHAGFPAKAFTFSISK